MKRETWLLPLVLAGACAEAQDTDAPSASPPDAAASDAGADVETDADSALPPSTCLGDWCSIEEARVATLSVNAVWGSSARDVWIAGGRGLVAHWDGSRWEERRPSRSDYVYSAIWGSAPDDVWVMSSTTSAFHFTRGPDAEGNTAPEPRWLKTSFGAGVLAPINALFGPAPDDLYVVPAQGHQEKDYDGFIGYADLASQLWHFTGRSDAGSEWTALTSPDRTCPVKCPSFQSVWARDRHGQWVAGTYGTIFRAGATSDPALQPVESNAVSAFAAVSGTSADDVWAVGAGATVRHWQGSRWEIVTVPTRASLRSVWTSAPDDVWIAGEGGTLLHYDGARWEEIAVPDGARDRDLRAVWGSSKTDVWVAGEKVLLHRGVLRGAP
ncbi:MAG: Type fimbrial biosis protein PilY1 [Labilithrix sp.]|nr:Type fimbrial biosis protein PilY1 [Labilithrix sp.]